MEPASDFAHIRFCRDCGLHGRIEYAFGFQSKEFFSVEEGAEIISESWSTGRITDAELRYLVGQLDSHQGLCRTREDHELFMAGMKLLGSVAQAMEDDAEKRNAPAN